MRIGEVAKLCRLTKKAISYYEDAGLLEKKMNSNGYRMYDEQDITILKEIYILRKLGLKVADIKEVLKSQDKKKLLQNYLTIQNHEMEQMKAQQEYLLHYLDKSLDIEEAFQEIDEKLEYSTRVKDKLLQAFPGVYGKYLFIHFGSFLEGQLDSVEKKEAFQNIVEYLDQAMEFKIDEEQQLFIEEQFSHMNDDQLHQLVSSVQKSIHDYDSFIENKKDVIEDYIAYRTSEAFKESSAYRLQQILVQFQKNSGYQELFIEKLKIVSDSYRSYHEQLQSVNERLLKDFPQVKKMNFE